VTTDAPNPFTYGSPDGSRRGRRAARAPLERVAKAKFSVAKLVLIDFAITAYLAFIGWAVFGSESESDAPEPPEAWLILGFTVLVLLGLLIGFGHFVLQYVGLLGVLYARSAGPGWEIGPGWGFVLRHRLRLEAGETLVITVDELDGYSQRLRNYGKYLWTLNASAGRVKFRSPVGLSPTVHEQATAWAEAHAVFAILGGVPQA
jgi:hypothetical protein